MVPQEGLALIPSIAQHFQGLLPPTTTECVPARCTCAKPLGPLRYLPAAPSPTTTNGTQNAGCASCTSPLSMSLQHRPPHCLRPAHLWIASHLSRELRTPHLARVGAIEQRISETDHRLGAALGLPTRRRAFRCGSPRSRRLNSAAPSGTSAVARCKLLELSESPAAV